MILKLLILSVIALQLVVVARAAFCYHSKPLLMDRGSNWVKICDKFKTRKVFEEPARVFTNDCSPGEVLKKELDMYNKPITYPLQFIVCQHNQDTKIEFSKMWQMYSSTRESVFKTNNGVSRSNGIYMFLPGISLWVNRDIEVKVQREV